MKIKILSPEVIMKIAAGEVVSGPNSVIKELIENSIDANADNIKVEIVDGGKSLIKVEDNGIGMTSEEIKLAILPHTTSKISSIDDIYSLQTFGFRGEALASISKVSRMKITSKVSEEELGTSLEIFGGKILDEKKVNTSTGTKIEIMDLFFNIPARRKFLKSNSAEGRYVTDIVEKFALSNSIDLIYTRDNKEIYRFSKDMDLATKCLRIYPELKMEDIIQVDYEDPSFKIYGVISHPKVGRSNRTAQTFFVNKRYVKAASLFSVLEKGYGTMLEKAVHPYAVVFIDISSDMVDVNVHPQKLEVKFSDERKVASLLKSTIRETLNEKTSFTLELVEKKEEPHFSENKSSDFSFQDLYDKESESYFKEDTNVEYYKDDQEPIIDKERNHQKNNKIISNNDFKYHETVKNTNNFDFSNYKDFKPITKLDFSNNLRIVGMVAGRYLIVESEDKILFVDFHAAHERYIYENLKKQLDEKDNLSYNILLSPVKIKLDNIRKEIILENKENLEKIGIIIEENKEEIIVKGLPNLLKINDVEKMILEVADNLRLSDLDNDINIFDKNLATIACRSAVKTGDNPTGMETLLKNILENKLLTCPHGRPIMFQISFKSLDKYFERF